MLRVIKLIVLLSSVVAPIFQHVHLAHSICLSGDKMERDKWNQIFQKKEEKNSKFLVNFNWDV